MKKKITTASAALFSETIPHHLVAERAYAIWATSGQPAGRDYDHWVEAEQQLLATRAQEESEKLGASFGRGGDSFSTDIDRALEAMAATGQPRSVTSL